MREEIEARQARGETVGAMDTFRIMKSTLGRLQRELLAERERLAAIHGNIYDQVPPHAPHVHVHVLMSSCSCVHVFAMGHQALPPSRAREAAPRFGTRHPRADAR
jgi:hypothetical protein